MRQLHSMDIVIDDMLNRGFTPCRMAYPTLAGRQRLEVSGLCLKGFFSSGYVKEERRRLASSSP